MPSPACVFLLLALVPSFALALCDNPLFSRLYNETQTPLHPLPHPPNSSFCPSFQSSCCTLLASNQAKLSHSLLTQVQSVNLVIGAVPVQEVLQIVQAELKGKIPDWVDLEKIVNIAVDKPDGINSMQKEVREFDLTVLSVARGVACLACESDWESFYSAEKKTLYLDEGTCGNFSLSALPLLAKLDTLKGALVEAVFQMAPAGGIPAGLITDIIKFTPMCTILAMAEIESPFLPKNFDCSAWLCSQIGFVTKLSMVTSALMGAEVTAGGLASRAIVSALPTLLKAMMVGEGKPPVGASITPPVATSFRATGGFPAYTQGCEGPSAKDCPTITPYPPATGTPTPKPSTLVTATPKPKRYAAIGGVPGLVAIVAAATVLLFVVVLVATRKPKERDNTYASLN